ncbi:MAG: histidinol dehydrogenase [Thermodesulfobacteriota bacterium]
MTCRYFSYQGNADWPTIEAWRASRQEPEPGIEQSVKDILTEVRTRGDQALVSFNRKFDCPDFSLQQLRVPEKARTRAMELVSRNDLDLILEAAENIRSFHQNQKERSWISHESPGLTTGQLINPVNRAGLYIPGGRSGDTPLVSSLLMNAVPAQVAGVKEIILTSPPGKDGNLNPLTLASAHVLGITEIFAVGSAWAVGGLAYGTESIPRVDMIAGPGNIFVTTAKRLLFSRTGIDMVAGPSEVVILADSTAKPKWLAADLLSQAEHDPLASAVVISPDPRILQDVARELNQQLDQLPRKEIAGQSLESFGALIQVPELTTGLELANQLAPEHLQLCIHDPWSMIGAVQNAGAVFLGHYCPESLGDYFAGPNHVLPTLGTARFTSGLSVQHFCKKTSLIAADQDYFARSAGKIARLARLEGLEAHARSAEIRTRT